MLYEEQLSEQVIGSCIEVHRELGPGLLESPYESCLCEEFRIRGVRYRRQVDLPICYKGVVLELGYRIDIIVEEKIIIEVKSVASILPIHEAQLLTYLRLTNLRLGFLINFNVPVLKDGIKRMVR